MTVNNTHAADVIAVMGATGAGKSSSIRVKLAADDSPRRLVWDPGEDFSEFGTVTDSERTLARAVVAAGAGPFRLVYRPSFDTAVSRWQFSRFCALAHAVGNVQVVADELEDVMEANWAPPGWAMLIRKGRKRGCRVIAASQRPAGIEKRIWSMATVIRSGRLNYADDAATVARVLMVDPRDVLRLEPLHFIQRSVYAPVIVWGRIEWRAGRPLEVKLHEKKLLPDLPQ